MNQLSKKAENFLKKSYLDHREIDARLMEYFKNRANNAKFFSFKKLQGTPHQSALGFILSFIGGILVAIWLFFLLTFGFSVAKADMQLNSNSETQISK